MPFEPLRTDEPYTGPAPKQKEFEAHLMGGCAVIVGTSVLIYALTIYPFFIPLPEYAAYTVDGMLRIGLSGALPAIIIGLIATRWSGYAGASGFVGGGLTSGIFIYLTLDQVMLGHLPGVELPMPEYPARWAWIIPLLWVLVCVALAGLLMPRDKEESASG